MLISNVYYHESSRRKRKLKKKKKKKVEHFYLTREWRSVRYQAIKKYGRKCQCCGAENTVIHVDHIKPRSKYPEFELDIENLQILCIDCNLGKSNKDETDWR